MLRNICWFSFLIWGNWINTVFLRRWVLRWPMILTSLLEEYSASVSSYPRLKYQICSLNSWIICATVTLDARGLLARQRREASERVFLAASRLSFAASPLNVLSPPTRKKPLAPRVRNCTLQFKQFGRSRVRFSPGALKIFVAPGEHSFSLFQEENIPWSICVLLTSP